MSFSYGMGSNPIVDFPRMLVGDTQSANHIFEDEEIQSFYVINAGFFQSSMLYTAPGGANLPTVPVSYLRVAAMMLDALASQKARLAVTGLLDAKVDFQKASQQLHAQAEAWRQIEDNSGAFMIIEQCTTTFGFLDRFYKQVQRQTAQ